MKEKGHSIFYDNKISYKAKGILMEIDSLKKDNVTVSVNRLVNESKDGVDAIRAGIKELVENGYLTVERNRDENGQLHESVYIIHANPKGIIRKH